MSSVISADEYGQFMINWIPLPSSSLYFITHFATLRFIIFCKNGRSLWQFAVHDCHLTYWWKYPIKKVWMWTFFCHLTAVLDALSSAVGVNEKLQRRSWNLLQTSRVQTYCKRCHSSRLKERESTDEIMMDLKALSLIHYTISSEQYDADYTLPAHKVSFHAVRTAIFQSKQFNSPNSTTCVI